MARKIPALKLPRRPGPEVHDLKCWRYYFEQIESGIKTFDVRKNYEGCFHAGDILILREFDAHANQYTGATLVRQITYTMIGGTGKYDLLPLGTHVIGLAPIGEKAVSRG